MLRPQLSVVINDNAKKLYAQQERLESMSEAFKALGMTHLEDTMRDVAWIIQGCADDLVGADCDEIEESRKVRSDD